MGVAAAAVAGKVTVRRNRNEGAGEEEREGGRDGMERARLGLAWLGRPYALELGQGILVQGEVR